MKILVINTGSSSIKYQLFDMTHREAVITGLAEKIGEEKGMLTHKKIQGNEKSRIKSIEGKIADHRSGLTSITELLVDPLYGSISDKSDIAAVGHRVVHGGETFQSSTIINEKVTAAITENIPLAPLHNPPNLTGIEVAMSLFPDCPHVAVFDTAFHQSIPQEAFLYALPYELYKNIRVRRYGFHGTSHSYVAASASEFLGRSLKELNIITIHLGNGASMAAVKNGKCIDTSMGMTPLEGLVMGTRSGDIDPALPFFLSDHLQMPLRDIDNLLNKQSGLKGICGTNDMREVMQKVKAGDNRGEIALDVYCYRIKKYIGAYFAALGRLDCLVFTAGIGENNPEIRSRCCKDLSELGIKIDEAKNKAPRSGITEISESEGKVKILVIPTNEEKKIAEETAAVIRNS
jgi:acetate kinase